jgi:hypothetical protein
MLRPTTPARTGDDGLALCFLFADTGTMPPLMQRMSLTSILTLALATAAPACTDARGDEAAVLARDTTTAIAGGNASNQRTASEPERAPLTEEERRFYQDVSRRAWGYLNANYKASTGFVDATPGWANTTMWDLGGQLLAFLSARELGLIDSVEYDRRIAKGLSTLEKIELYRNVAFNKIYSTKDGSITRDVPGGWSATDIGRLFLALKILSVREPRWAEQAQRIVRRGDLSAIVKDGYLHGEASRTDGRPAGFQEGRIGYEQYVAKGFEAWGAAVGNAANVRTNARAVTVLGVQLLGDRRSQDRLLSEPFILQGLEVGLTGDMRELAGNLLKAQEARFNSTGQVTIVSEDAVAVAPHHFYYYCVYCSGKPFVVNIFRPGEELDAPRWVSTKGAYGWHAIMPNAYTKRATDYVAPALDAQKGWATGVYEGSRKSTETYDVNTAAVMMEIAYFQLRGGKPLIEPGARPR